MCVSSSRSLSSVRVTRWWRRTTVSMRSTRSRGFEPLVIVLDLEMPRLDGEGLIRELAERAAPVPHVIVFTAHPFRRPKSATMCIEKPCAPSRLVGAVSMVLASPYGEEP